MRLSFTLLHYSMMSHLIHPQSNTPKENSTLANNRCKLRFTLHRANGIAVFNPRKTRATVSSNESNSTAYGIVISLELAHSRKYQLTIYFFSIPNSSKDGALLENVKICAHIYFQVIRRNTKKSHRLYSPSFFNQKFRPLRIKQKDD